MQRGPLVLVSVSNSRQSEQQLRNELLYVYNQIISMLTQASITRIFEHKKNYDLRRLLAGSEKILDGLLDLVDSDPSLLLSAVHCLPLASSLRDSLSQILQKAITPNLVFSILIAKNQLLTIVQEKMVIDDARLEPADLHLLLNLIGASSAFQAGEIWTPICLPSFNPDCYFYAYISYLDPPECTVCLVLLSTDKEAFYSVAECKRKIEEAMQMQNALNSIAKAHSYSVSQVGVSDLRHFMYKPFDVPDNHRQLTQFTRWVVWGYHKPVQLTFFPKYIFMQVYYISSPIYNYCDAMHLIHTFFLTLLNCEAFVHGSIWLVALNFGWFRLKVFVTGYFFV